MSNHPSHPVCETFLAILVIKCCNIATIFDWSNVPRSPYQPHRRFRGRPPPPHQPGNRSPILSSKNHEAAGAGAPSLSLPPPDLDLGQVWQTSVCWCNTAPTDRKDNSAISSPMWSYRGTWSGLRKRNVEIWITNWCWELRKLVHNQMNFGLNTVEPSRLTHILTSTSGWVL